MHFKLNRRQFLSLIAPLAVLWNVRLRTAKAHTGVVTDQADKVDQADYIYADHAVTLGDGVNSVTLPPYVAIPLTDKRGLYRLIYFSGISVWIDPGDFQRIAAYIAPRVLSLDELPQQMQVMVPRAALRSYANMIAPVVGAVTYGSMIKAVDLVMRGGVAWYGVRNGDHGLAWVQAGYVSVT